MKFKTLTILFMVVLMMSYFATVPGVPQAQAPLGDMTTMTGIPEDILPEVMQALAEDPRIPEDFDLNEILPDRVNQYKTNYEPWKSKAAIHAVAYDEAFGFLALGGGWLYDNEIHLWRLNTETGMFDKVWDIGDSQLPSDVMSLAFGDTDLNDFIEIAAGCADGRVYVFEQRHLYDPYANTENQFDLVWKSPYMFKVFDLKIDDIDKDYRPDIIAGGWDNKVHIFEYSNHSGYPFVQEHWITYNEVATLPVDDKVYSLETGDTNANGLPEVVVGTRDGTVYVFENDGITIYINGHPFPLIYDNHYYLNWTSEAYTWRPIISMAVGEIDGTDGDEIALVSQGQGVYTLDWNSAEKSYDYERVYKDYEPWETFGYWGLDYYVDRVIYAHNVTYHDPVNVSINVPEPIQYVRVGGAWDPDADVYPYNTGMAMMPDGNYSTFDCTNPSVDNATAIVDFGLDEEGTGGANAAGDILMTFRYNLNPSIFDHLNFSISQDGTDFEQVSVSHMTIGPADLRVLNIDVDSALGRRQWEWFRYAKIVIYGSVTYEVNSLELTQVYNLLTDALSITIGPMKMDGENFWTGGDELDKVIVGTVTGEVIVVGPGGSYDVLWQSGDDADYTMGANIWDMAYIPGQEPDIPTWNYQLKTNLPVAGGLGYNSWTWAVPEPDIWGYLLGTQDGEIQATDLLGNPEPMLTPLIAPINSDLDPVLWPYTSAEVTYLPFITPTTAIAVGKFNPDVPIDSYGVSTYYRAHITFYYRSDWGMPFSLGVDLWELDLNGELSQLIDHARTTPKMDFADIDSDNDLDFVVSNGYLYLAKNLAAEYAELEIEDLKYVLVPGYFDDINALATNRIWGQPDFVDLDDDGDFDLVLSYGDKNGATCFINKGTVANPEWVEDKMVFSNRNPDTNMAYLNLTDVRAIPHWGDYYDGFNMERWYDYYGLEPDRPFYIAAHNIYEEKTYWMSPQLGTTDTYVIATYPRVVQVDFSIMSAMDEGAGFNRYINLGYNIHESWSNDDDLNNWTLCIASADTDQDGNGEIIVGDFDNNVYAFEHLSNNTYKRMFRSFDLNHSEVSDVSPYYYEELEGISGDFNRKIWDHAKHLVADVDLDQDGLKEIIVAADLQVYIFEEVGLTGGDAIRFVYGFDLGQSEWEGRYTWEYAKEITAMGAASDLDYDGRMELVVAAGPFLFIFNVDIGLFEDMEQNDYFVTSLSLEGRYFMLGNPEKGDFEFAEINALTLCDTDKDGYREVILGGIADNRPARDSGFVYVYECQAGTFYKVWEAPSEVTMWNPVSVLTLDDQDYDGNCEIIIGHTKGFDIWEHIPGTDSKYQKVEYVTASPNYPMNSVKTALFEATGEQFLIDFPNDLRGASDMAHGSGIYEGYIWAVYEQDSEIYYKVYIESSGLWIPGAAFSDTWDFGPGISYFSNPSIVCHPTDGSFWVAFEATATNGSHYIGVFGLDTNTPAYLGPLYYPDPGGLFPGRRMFPSVFILDSTNIGIACRFDGWVLDGMIYTYKQGNIRAYSRPKDLTGSWAALPVNFQNRNALKVHSLSVAKLPDGSYALAMSAENYQLTKADHDIWVVVGNSTFQFDGKRAHQATVSYYDEMYPSVDYLRSEDHSIIVMYEAVAASLEEKLGMVASTTGGSTWSVADYLNPVPDTVTRMEGLWGEVYYVKGGLPLNGPMAYAGSVIGRDGAGFMYLFPFTSVVHYQVSDVYWIHYPVGDLVYGVNPQSDWVHNHLRNVVDLDVGDTDQDGRREVVVGFEHQIGVYELKHSTNGTGFMTYDEAWLSLPYENKVTGVTLYDTNRNGFPEIGVATERGNVYFLEFIDPSVGATSPMSSEVDWSFNTTGMGSYIYMNLLQSYDVDGDELDEIIYALSSDSQVVCLDDDGSILWSNSDPVENFHQIFLADLNNDTIPELLLAGNGVTLYVLDITDGHELWSYNGATDDVYGITTGDFTGDGVPEVVISTRDGWVHTIAANGTALYAYDITSSAINYITTGHFYNRSELLAAMVTSLNQMIVVNPLNGTIVYQSPTAFASTFSNFAIHDFNGNGLDDILFANVDGLSIIDLSTLEVYYNTTDMGLVAGIFVEDFDGDGNKEVLIHSLTDGVFLEEIDHKVTRWHYDFQNEDMDVYDANIGFMGGSGSMDILIASTNADGDAGLVVALDGMTGLPLWYNVTFDSPVEVTAARIHPVGPESLVCWEVFNYMIHVVSGVEYAEPDLPSYMPHQEYWSVDLPTGDIDETRVYDLDGDGIDEIIFWNVNDQLYVWDAETGTELWHSNVGVYIRDVSFGNVDGLGWHDIALRLGNDEVVVVEGSTGDKITVLPAPSGYDIEGISVSEFNTGHANHELFVLYQQSSSPWNTFGVWYDEDAQELFRFDTNQTDSSSFFTVRAGGFTGNAAHFDIAWGGSSGGSSIYVYDGSNGVYQWDIAAAVWGMHTGDLNGDGFEDIAIVNSADDIRAYDSLTQALLIDLFYSTGAITDWDVGDIPGGADEVIVYVDEIGIEAYDAAENLVWYFDARLVVGSSNAQLEIADMNGDGANDLVVTNYNYLQVVDGTSGRILWHHVGSGTHWRPLVGQFIRIGNPLDVVCYNGNRLYVVSGVESASPPPVPSFAEAEVQDTTLIDSVVAVSLFAIPLALLFFGPTAYLRRYRKRNEDEV
ncbi:MAG: hypothetical protein EAX95_11355 [Candidatus Thorarchaeota archaeon]|nr:hypothetical protein [Candidatus Thorarchaeota archaeon]